MSQQTLQKTTAQKPLKLRVKPLRNLGVQRLLGRDAKFFSGCRATQGGSCQINCTGPDVTI